MAPNQTLMAVGVKSNPTTLEVSPPKALFATRIKWMEIQAVAHHYAAAPDGQRFLISSATDEARSVPVTIVLNWSAALEEVKACAVLLLRSQREEHYESGRDQQFRHLATIRVMSSRCSCGLKRRTPS